MPELVLELLLGFGILGVLELSSLFECHQAFSAEGWLQQK